MSAKPMGRVSKILIADDSNVAQRMGKEILVAEGYEVLTVNNGHTALKKISDFAPDLILADIFMPGASGYELCQTVRADPKFGLIPIVLMVGAMEPYDKEEARRVGADGILTKPLQSTDVVTLVSDLLAPSRDRIADEPDDAVSEEESHIGLDRISAIAGLSSKQEMPAATTSPILEEIAEESADTDSLVHSHKPAQESEATAGPVLSVFQELIESPDQATDSPDLQAATTDEPDWETPATLMVQKVEEIPESPIPFPQPERADLDDSESRLPVRLEFLPEEADEEKTVSAAKEVTDAEADAGFSVPDFPTALSQLEQSLLEVSKKEPETSSASDLTLPAVMSMPVEEEVESQQVATEELHHEEEPRAESEPAVAETLHYEPVDDTPRRDFLTAGIAWTAETVEVTEADRNLFEKAFPDWDGLAKLVHGAGDDDTFDYSQKKSGSGPSFSEAASSDSLSATALEDEVEPLILETPSHPFLVEHREAGAPVLELDPVPESRHYSTAQTAIDPLMLHQMIRDSVESMLPEVVDRIVNAVESALLKPHS